MMNLDLLMTPKDFKPHVHALGLWVCLIRFQKLLWWRSLSYFMKPILSSWTWNQCQQVCFTNVNLATLVLHHMKNVCLPCEKCLDVKSSMFTSEQTIINLTQRFCKRERKCITYDCISHSSNINKKTWNSMHLGEYIVLLNDTWSTKKPFSSLIQVYLRWMGHKTYTI